MHERHGKYGRKTIKFAVAAAALFVLLILSAAIAESAGWPFLARPLEKQLSRVMNRELTLSAGDFKIRFLGKIRLEIGSLVIAAPSWSKTAVMVQARSMKLTLGYSDIWAAYKGQRLNVIALSAGQLNAHLERTADGRVSWQLRQTRTLPPPIPHFNRLEIADGTVIYSDEQLRLAINAELSANAADNTLNVQGTGHYREMPLKFKLISSNTLPWESRQNGNPRMGLTADATIGRAAFSFEGTAGDVNSFDDVRGQFTLKGPSLSAVGDPVGVTLPTTSAFKVNGVVVKDLDLWNVTLKSLRIGSSKLSGAFQFDKKNNRNLLSGRLDGAHLKLADLGPVIGGTAIENQKTDNKSSSKKTKVLPSRPFDLAALRVMDANVLIDIKEVDLNTPLLEPLRPLKAHLQLLAGVLTISQIQANTAQGNVTGQIKLDGRDQKALWTAALNWEGVRLERWLKLSRGEGLPAYVSGKIKGRTTLQGEGKSTSEILASLKGSARTQIQNGSVSHLLIEAAGLDIAQALGVFIKGDDALPITCAIADLVVAKGIFTPRVMVIDTIDSAVWVQGNVSLASETLDLKAVVAPKDFSPFALRSPVLVQGAFSQPKVSIEKGPLGLKIGSALLLSFINPLAAIIPFIDLGDTEGAKNATAGCANLVKKASRR